MLLVFSCTYHRINQNLEEKGRSVLREYWENMERGQKRDIFSQLIQLSGGTGDKL